MIAAGVVASNATATHGSTALCTRVCSTNINPNHRQYTALSKSRRGPVDSRKLEPAGAASVSAASTPTPKMQTDAAPI